MLHKLLLYDLEERTFFKVTFMKHKIPTINNFFLTMEVKVYSCRLLRTKLLKSKVFQFHVKQDE